MTTFAVTVTYGNRFHLLKQVCESAFAEGISKVIVVDNNSVPQSREKLKAYEYELRSDKIKVLYLDDNYGSTGGFKRGLEEAYNHKECEYILVLDDDNVILENSMKKVNYLTSYLENLDNNYILSFYRPEREDNNRIVKNGWIKGYLANFFHKASSFPYNASKAKKFLEDESNRLRKVCDCRTASKYEKALKYFMDSGV